ncbi:MAG: hypothetical protein WB676_00320 [Bryobacteraceae bacterium]
MLIWLAAAIWSAVVFISLWFFKRVLDRAFGHPVDRGVDKFKNWRASRNQESLKERIDNLQKKLDDTKGWEFTPAQVVLYNVATLIYIFIGSLATWMSFFIGLVADGASRSGPAGSHLAFLLGMMAAVTLLQSALYLLGFRWVTRKWDLHIPTRRASIQKTIDELTEDLKARLESAVGGEE